MSTTRLLFRLFYRAQCHHLECFPSARQFLYCQNAEGRDPLGIHPEGATADCCSASNAASEYSGYYGLHWTFTAFTSIFQKSAVHYVQIILLIWICKRVTTLRNVNEVLLSIINNILLSGCDEIPHCFTNLPPHTHTPSLTSSLLSYSPLEWWALWNEDLTLFLYHMSILSSAIDMLPLYMQY